MTIKNSFFFVVFFYCICCILVLENNTNFPIVLAQSSSSSGSSSSSSQTDDGPLQAVNSFFSQKSITHPIIQMGTTKLDPANNCYYVYLIDSSSPSTVLWKFKFTQTFSFRGSTSTQGLVFLAKKSFDGLSCKSLVLDDKFNFCHLACYNSAGTLSYKIISCVGDDTAMADKAAIPNPTVAGNPAIGQIGLHDLSFGLWLDVRRLIAWVSSGKSSSPSSVALCSCDANIGSGIGTFTINSATSYTFPAFPPPGKSHLAASLAATNPSETHLFVSTNTNPFTLAIIPLGNVTANGAMLQYGNTNESGITALACDEYSSSVFVTTASPGLLIRISYVFNVRYYARDIAVDGSGADANFDLTTAGIVFDFLSGTLYVATATFVDLNVKYYSVPKQRLGTRSIIPFNISFIKEATDANYAFGSCFNVSGMIRVNCSLLVASFAQDSNSAAVVEFAALIPVASSLELIASSDEVSIADTRYSCVAFAPNGKFAVAPLIMITAANAATATPSFHVYSTSTSINQDSFTNLNFEQKQADVSAYTAYTFQSDIRTPRTATMLQLLQQSGRSNQLILVFSTSSAASPSSSCSLVTYRISEDGNSPVWVSTTPTKLTHACTDVASFPSNSLEEDLYFLAGGTVLCARFKWNGGTPQVSLMSNFTFPPSSRITNGIAMAFDDSGAFLYVFCQTSQVIGRVAIQTTTETPTMADGGLALSLSLGTVTVPERNLVQHNNFLYLPFLASVALATNGVIVRVQIGSLPQDVIVLNRIAYTTDYLGLAVSSWIAVMIDPIGNSLFVMSQTNFGKMFKYSLEKATNSQIPELVGSWYGDPTGTKLYPLFAARNPVGGTFLVTGQHDVQQTTAPILGKSFVIGTTYYAKLFEFGFVEPLPPATTTTTTTTTSSETTSGTTIVSVTTTSETRSNNNNGVSSTSTSAQSLTSSATTTSTSNPHQTVSTSTTSSTTTRTTTSVSATTSNSNSPSLPTSVITSSTFPSTTISDNTSSIAENTTTTTTSENNFTSAPTQLPKPHDKTTIEKANVAVGSTSAVVSSLSANLPAATTAFRALTMMQLASCGNLSLRENPLDFDGNPLNFNFPDDETDANGLGSYVGAVVGNLVLLIAFAGVIFIAVLVHKYVLVAKAKETKNGEKCKKENISFDEAFARSRAPGVFSLIWVLFGPPSCKAFAVVFASTNGRTTRDVVIAIPSVIFYCVIPTVLGIHIYLHVRKNETLEQFDKENDGDESTNKNEGKPREPSKKSHREVLNEESSRSILLTIFKATLMPEAEWAESPFVRKYGLVFECYSNGYFFVFDYIITIGIAILSGNALVCDGVTCCKGNSIVILVLALTHTFVVLYTRPFLNRMDKFLMVVLSLCVSISASLAVASNFGAEVGDAMNAFGMSELVLTFIDAVFTILPLFYECHIWLRDRCDKTREKNIHASRSRGWNLLSARERVKKQQPPRSNNNSKLDHNNSNAKSNSSRKERAHSSSRRNNTKDRHSNFLQEQLLSPRNGKGDNETELEEIIVNNRGDKSRKSSTSSHRSSSNNSEITKSTVSNRSTQRKNSINNNSKTLKEFDDSESLLGIRRSSSAASSSSSHVTRKSGDAPTKERENSQRTHRSSSSRNESRRDARSNEKSNSSHSRNQNNNDEAAPRSERRSISSSRRVVPSSSDNDSRRSESNSTSRRSSSATESSTRKTTRDKTREKRFEDI